MTASPAPDLERLPASTVERLCATPGITATVSDLLDELGWRLTVPATALPPRQTPTITVVGYAITSRYLPARDTHPAVSSTRPPEQDAPPPAFDPGYRLGQPGDVLVLAANGLDGTSVFGGRVALAAKRAGVGGVVVDGAVRDLDEINGCALPVWSRGVTPITGKTRLEQSGVNVPVFFAGVQVRPGDLVIADASGVCFVPALLAAEVAERALGVAAAEAAASRTAP